MGFDHRTIDIKQAESALAAAARSASAYESAVDIATRGIAGLSAAGQLSGLRDSFNPSPSIAEAALGIIAPNKTGLAATSTGVMETVRTFNSAARDSLTLGLANNKLSQFNNLISAFQAPSAFDTFTGQLAGLSATQQVLRHDPWKPALMRWSRPLDVSGFSRLESQLRIANKVASAAAGLGAMHEPSALHAAIRQLDVSSVAQDAVQRALRWPQVGQSYTPEPKIQRRAPRSGGQVLVFPDTRTFDTSTTFPSPEQLEARLQAMWAYIVWATKEYGPNVAYEVYDIAKQILIAYLIAQHMNKP